jgi:hypothetical protein
MAESDFRFHLALWLGLLVLQAVLFPYLLHGMVTTMCGGNCQGGAGGALGVVIGMFLKPVLVIIPIIGLTRAVFLRCMWLSLGLLWATVFALLCISLGGMFTFLGNFWGANFATGNPFFSIAPTSLFFVATAVFLSLNLNPIGFTESDRSKWAWRLAAGALGHVTIVNLPAILLGLPLAGSFLFVLFAPVYRALVSPLFPVLTLGMSTYVSYIDLAVFITALIMISIEHDWNSTSEKPQPVSPQPESVSTSSRPAGFGKRTFK